MSATDHAASALLDDEVLRGRARVLARPPGRPDDGEAIEVLEFALARERYAVETRYVDEVLPFTELTPVPCTPAFVRGIVNARGRLLAVLDVKRFFDLPEEGLTDLHSIIVVNGREMSVGLLADAIVGVREVPVGELQAALPTLTGIRADYLKGVTSERLVVLDLPSIIADPRIIVHDEVES